MNTLESTYDETIRCASKWFILTQRKQNLSSVDLNCVTSYTQPIPLSLTPQDTILSRFGLPPPW